MVENDKNRILTIVLTYGINQRARTPSICRAIRLIDMVCYFLLRGHVPRPLPAVQNDIAPKLISRLFENAVRKQYY